MGSEDPRGGRRGEGGPLDVQQLLRELWDDERPGDRRAARRSGVGRSLILVRSAPLGERGTRPAPRQEPVDQRRWLDLVTGGQPGEVDRVGRRLWTWSPEQVALTGGDPKASDDRQLFSRLDAFGDHRRVPLGGEALEG